MLHCCMYAVLHAAVPIPILVSMPQDDHLFALLLCSCHLCAGCALDVRNASAYFFMSHAMLALRCFLHRHATKGTLLVSLPPAK